jgi:hypothetical protein
VKPQQSEIMGRLVRFLDLDADDWWFVLQPNVEARDLLWLAS